MNYPKVSIIIPTFNRAKYLKKAIESALEQDYPNLEVIVSDNASTDDTPSVVKNFLKNKKLRYFRNKTNIGMVANWRKALYNYVSGEWAIILSDDDYFVDKSFISKAINLILRNKNKNILLLHANLKIKDERRNIILEKKRIFPEIMNGKKVFINYNKNNQNFYFCTVLFHVKTMKKINAFSHYDVVGSDTMEFLRLSLRGNVAFLKDVVSVYRIHKGSTMPNINLELTFKNLKGIIIPYLEAKKLKIFSNNVLDKWLKYQKKVYFNSVLQEIFRKGDFKLYLRYFYKIKQEHPDSLTIFLYPKNILKLLIMKFPRISNLLYRIKYRKNFSK